MILFLQAAPLIVLVAVLVLARGRLGAAAPVLAALAVAIPAAWVSLPAGTALPPFLAAEALRGAWLALAPAAITAAGLLFHEAVTGEAEARPTAPGARGHAALFTAVFLLGPFFETVTGFGIGVVFSLSAMRRLGVPAPAAAALSLLSQVLIPWGALGPGTLLGAALAGVDLRAFGAWTSAASAAWLLLLLPLFWRLAREAGLGGTARERGEDAVTMLVLVTLLVAANLLATVEVAGLIALSPPLLVRLLREGRGLADARARRAALPYLALSLVLLATRLVPPVQAVLTGHAVLRPYPDLPGIAVLHHPATMLALVALPMLASRREGRRAALARAGARARMPILLLVLYVVLARWLGASGAAASLAGALAASAGPVALPFVTPFLGAAGGFFTGTNVGSNSILMPIQSALAGKQGFPAAFLPALQNFTGSALCILAPMRISATAALAADGTTEADLYRRLWWTGLAAVLAALGWIAALRLG
jgi:lactate permease